MTKKPRNVCGELTRPTPPMTPTPTRRQRAIQLAVFLTAFFVVWSLRATVFFAIDEQIASEIWRGVYSNLLKRALWVLPAVVFAAWLRKASPARYLGLSNPSRLQTWLRCLTVTAAYLGAV